MTTAVVPGFCASGCSSLGDLAAALDERRMRTPREGHWHPASVKNLLERLEAAA
jgi:hypothetical protein